MSRAEGGHETARVSAAAADQAAREERQADALAWLDRNGIDDIPIILGLRPEPCAACGAPAVRMGYCDAAPCQAELRRTARKVGDSTYRKARRAVGTG